MLARVGAVVLATLLSAVACTTTPSVSAEPCVTNGGTCAPSTDLVACSAFPSYACGVGYTCCTLADAAALVDAYVVDAADATMTPVDAPVTLTDAGVDAAAADAVHDVTHLDARADAPVDAHAHAESSTDAEVDDESDAHREAASAGDGATKG